MGDFAFPRFKLAKARRKAPPLIAQDLVQELREKNVLPEGLQVAATGPYVNFLTPAKQVTTTVLKDLVEGTGLGSYGQVPPKSREKWVLEYSSPNVAKPFNIYHLRPTALGAALDRIGRFRGFDVTSINHLGDWGTQYGKLAVAVKLYQSELPAEPTINDLVRIYVKFHEALENDPTLAEQAREAFLKLEQDDPEITALWKKCLEVSLIEFNRLYDRLGVQFDHIWGESHYREFLEPLLQDLRKRGLLIESEGAWVVPVEDENGNELPPCILQKKDGATIYATRDVAAAIYRAEKFNFQRMTYIVGQEQKLHFQQVFGVLRKMGFPWAKNCEHIPFGLYRFKDAKMSTRKGNFVTLESVLEMTKDRVRSIIEERSSQVMNAEEKEANAEAIAVGALIFHDLSADPTRDIEFDLDRVVDFEGETGPYLQYAHTRCLSILRKAQDQGYGALTWSESKVAKLQKEEEILLIKTLGQFPTHLERTLRFAKASQLAHYLIDVTHAFGSFYRECHVLGEDQELSEGRLLLVEATRRILAQGMRLLGMPLPERM